MNSESVPDLNRSGFETFLSILPTLFYVQITVFIESYLQLGKNACFLLEIFTIIIPQILSMTILADYVNMILYFLFMISSIILVWCFQKTSSLKSNKFDTKFITNSRSSINILAVIAILAVDFIIFPYRFEKTTTLGYSLMDTGVGLYVFANGVVSPESRKLKNPILKSVKGSLILLIIGMGRFFLTQFFDYHVAPSEYGIHWNFFITLGVTKVLTSFVLNVFKIRYLYVNAALLLLAHQILLQCGVQEFVFEDQPRDNFLLANKEGIVSSLGFVCLYLFSVYFGYCLKLTSKSQSVLLVMKKHLLAAFLFLFFSIVFQQFFGISRRLANAAYVCWILFLGIFSECIFYLIQVAQEKVFNRPLYVPCIYEAINYNGLVFFLLANILTGIINLGTDTKEYDALPAFLINLGYMVFNCLVVGYLYARGIKAKL